MEHRDWVNIYTKLMPPKVIHESFKSAQLKYLQERTILTNIVIHLNNLGPSQELHHKSRSHNGGNPKFHHSSPVWCKNNTHPIKGISTGGGMDAIKWKLTAYQKDEKRNDSVDHLLSEGNFPVSWLNLRQKWKKWSHQMQHSKSSSHFQKSSHQQYC